METNSKAFVFSYNESNPNWNRDHIANLLFLRGVQNHMNEMLRRRGYVFLNEVLACAGIPVIREGQTLGWSLLREGSEIDMGLFGDPLTGIRLKPDEDVTEALPKYEGMMRV